MVYSRAIISTLNPRFRAVSAVTGPMHATAARWTAGGSRPPSNACTKLLTVDDEVKVITSTPSPANSLRSRSREEAGQTVS